MGEREQAFRHGEVSVCLVRCVVCAEMVSLRISSLVATRASCELRVRDLTAGEATPEAGALRQSPEGDWRPDAMAGMARTPCTPKAPANGKKSRDTSFEMCDDFCSATFSRTHCSFCKCRSCTFCKPSNATVMRAERRIRGRELSASWCEDALMKRPNHLFRRMWAAESWAPMEPGKPACWERRRDAPHRRLKPRSYFAQAENGTFCKTNWYEGHAGPLGEPGHVPKFGGQPAPALLGYDDGIFDACAAAVARQATAGTLSASSRSSPCRRDRPGHVARCCLAAGLNILNMVGHRVPYNLCRNFEWQLCAISGALPGQPDRTIRFANAPRSLDVEPLARQESRSERAQCERAKRQAQVVTAAGQSGGRKNGYSLPDIFHLEVCLYNQVCTNGHRLFDLAVGEPFVCDFSHARFDALQQVLLAGSSCMQEQMT